MEIQENQWCKVHAKSEDLRARHTDDVSSSTRAGEDQCPTQVGQRANSPSLCLFVLSGPQWIGWHSLPLGRAICSAQSTSSSALLIQKHLHRHTQECLTMWASHGPVKLIIVLTSEYNEKEIMLVLGLAFKRTDSFLLALLEP